MAPKEPGTKVVGAQTLARGVDMLDVVGRSGPLPLAALAQRLGLTRSTTHRLASALVKRGFLQVAAQGYLLGAKLLRLGALAEANHPLTAAARPYLERLAREEHDPVNLAIREGGLVRYVAQVRGDRRIEVRSVIGETRLLAATALGRALLLDADEAEWRKAHADLASTPDSEDEFVRRMRTYKRLGAAFDIEENEDRVRCVAAPIRAASGQIIAALSLSSLPQYMDDARMSALVEPVWSTALAISRHLGFDRL
ncbi:IclR family transcriptional regulator [Caulobacter rhizosphaerae]|uniref:IclR family transcriptional regulator n=1 Tax=Caulobacter rhizosphaerae TaxID=2010972 RepID=UPI0013D282CC|nr:IclR family transcriptional regulator [Caulobacter rhizosphaerae]GGL34997.1 IclR family transcriptional regulator [Caulobacter rhizosphaerae]